MVPSRKSLKKEIIRETQKELHRMVMKKAHRLLGQMTLAEIFQHYADTSYVSREADTTLADIEQHLKALEVLYPKPDEEFEKRLATYARGLKNG